MKIALISGTLPPFPCGVGKHTHCLASALVEQGHDVTIFSLPADSRIPASSKIEQLNHFGFHSYWRLSRQLKQGQFDVVHLQYPTKRNARGLSIVVLPLLLRLSGLKVVMTLHEFSRASLLGRFRNMLLVVGCQRVILPNQDDLASLSWNRHKLVHVPLGPTILAQPKPGIAITPDSIGFLGFLDGSKGEQDLLQAVALLQQPVHLKFLTTLNPQLPHHQQLQRQVDQLKLASMVEWINPDNDQSLADQLQSCSIVALPFRLGVTTRNSTLLEALSYGKPTIAAVIQAPDMLVDGYNCLLVPTQDPQVLAQAIKRLLESSELRQHLQAGALATMAPRDWPAIAIQTVAVYHSL